MPRGWPLLRQAPSRMAHNGSIAAMILLSVALLAGLVAAGPLFGSATYARGLARQLALIPETTAPNLRPLVQVTVRNGPPAADEPRIRSLVDAVPYLGAARTSVAADAWQLDSWHPTPYLSANGHKAGAVLYFRTGAVDALQIASGKHGAPGLWLPESTAKDFGIRAGSTIQVGKSYRYNIPSCGSPLNPILGKVPPGSSITKVKVAGTYRTAPDGRLPLGSYFSGISSILPGGPDACPSTGLLMIGDRATIDTAIAALDEEPVWTYTASLTAAGRTPAHLRQAAAAAATVRLEAAQPGSAVYNLMSDGQGEFQIDSGLPAISQKADQDAAAARQQGRGISYAGGILGLAAVIVALRALSQRRRRETELLLGLGTPTRIVVAAGTLELLLPAVIGAAGGCAAACLAFDRFGPFPQLDPVAIRSAAVLSALVALVVLVSNAVVTLGQARQVSRALAGLSGSRFGSQWLSLLTGATIIAVVATLTREHGQSFRDPMSALLPILVLACGCSLVVRTAGGAGSAVRRWRSRRPDQSRPSADRLVLRGLRRTGVAVPDLIIVLAIGVGVLAYGLLSATLVDKSITDKAAVLAGAPSSVHIQHSWLLGGGGGPSPHVAAGTSMVWRASGVLTPDNQVYDVLVVNPATLAGAATWGAGPELVAARQALSDLAGQWRPTPKPATTPNPAGDASSASTAASPAPTAARLPTLLPALLVGPSDRKAGTTAQLQVGSVKQPIAVFRRLAAFPGAVHPTLVIDARTFFPQLDRNDDPSRKVLRGMDFEGDFASWVWTRQSLPSLLGRLGAHGVPPLETQTLAQARATPVFASGRWAAGYQVVLGLAAAALAGLAVVVAVDRRVARAAPVDLMLTRFGVRPRRLLALRTLELAITCLGALAVLALPLTLTAVLLPRLVEPDRAVPPAMPVHVSVLPLLISAAAAVVVTVVAALAAARRSAALKPGEVLRDDA